MHMHGSRASDDVGPASYLQAAPAANTGEVTCHLRPSANTSSITVRDARTLQAEPTGFVEQPGDDKILSTRGPGPSFREVRTQAVQTEPVVVLSPQDRVYLSEGGDCVHGCENCRGLRQAGHVKSKKVCQYCIRSQQR